MSTPVKIMNNDAKIWVFQFWWGFFVCLVFCIIKEIAPCYLDWSPGPIVGLLPKK